MLARSRPPERGAAPGGRAAWSRRTAPGDRVVPPRHAGALALLISVVVATGLAGCGNRNRSGAGGPAPPRFVDLAPQAGVDHQHLKPQLDPRVRNIHPWLASVGAAAATADYDLDGDLDLAVTASRYGEPNRLYRNDGDLQFSEVAERAGVARVNEEHGVSIDLIFGDIDNDGDDDLFVAKWGCNILFRNEGDGTFTDVTTAAGLEDCGNACAALFIDYDQDALLDLLVINYFDYVDLWHLPHTRIMHDDFERARNAGPNLLYHNRGDGTFEELAAEVGLDDTGWGLDAGAADYDNDGDQDIYVANDFGNDQIFRNDGGGRFTNVSASAIGPDTKKGMNVDFGDYDNDGWLDVYIANITTAEYLKEGNMLQHNAGDGTFVDVALESGVWDGGWGWGAKFLDFDNDTDLDLLAVNGFISAGEQSYWYDLATWATTPGVDPAEATSWPEIGNRSFSGYEPTRLFRNDGAAGFRESAADYGLDDRRDGRGIVVADFDEDGDLDFYVTNQGQRAALYRNDGGNRRHWLQVALHATRSNRDAIGARVTAAAGGVTMMREIDGGNGYSAQSSRILHFGLGDAVQVDRLEVRWPGGARQVVAGVAADQRLELSEDDARPVADAAP